MKDRGNTLKAPDFLKEQKEVITEDALTTLKEYADKFLEQQAIKEKLEKELKNTKAELYKYSSELIPQLLLSNGLSEIKLSSGEKIIIKEDVSVTISDDPLFHAFLEERDESDILKTQFSFDRMEQDQLDALFGYLEENEYEFGVKKDAHPQTKKKYFKELLGLGIEGDALEEGLSIGQFKRREDLEVFAKIFTFYVTKIK